MLFKLCDIASGMVGAYLYVKRVRTICRGEFLYIVKAKMFLSRSIYEYNRALCLRSFDDLITHVQLQGIYMEQEI